MQFFDFSSLQVPYSDETNLTLETTASELRTSRREPNMSQSGGIGSSIQDHCQTEHASRTSQTGSDEGFLHTGFPKPTAQPITHGADLTAYTIFTYGYLTYYLTNCHNQMLVL